METAVQRIQGGAGVAFERRIKRGESEGIMLKTIKKSRKKFVGKKKAVVKVRFPFYSFSLYEEDIRKIDKVNDQGFLNDSVVDFFLNHLVFHLLDESPSRVHVFPSALWYFMKGHQDHDREEDEDKISVRSEVSDLIKIQNHEYKLKQLTLSLEGIDLFDFDYLLFPIFNNGHWSLILVCQPYLLTFAGTNAEEENLSAAFIIFDSDMKNEPQHFNNAGTLADFIKAQHKIVVDRSQRESSEGKTNTVPDLTILDKPKGLNYSVVLPVGMPQQLHAADSGVFMLEYAERFFTNTPNTQTILENGFDFAATYPDFSVDQKRRELMEVIRQFSAY
uniref:ULP_PROTEASE domain-containing protein n=1 Tax=Rhabditophanes sp. KR3021 TaxID=114890 RepID=A0AC35TL59_9BILA